MTSAHLATTLQDVRLDLAKEDAAEAARGLITPHKMTMTAFLTMALDLEEQQYVVHSVLPLMWLIKSLDAVFDLKSH